MTSPKRQLGKAAPTCKYASAGTPCPDHFIGALNKGHGRPEGLTTPEDWKVVQPWHPAGDAPGHWVCLCGVAFGNNLQADIHISQARVGKVSHQLVWWCGHHAAPEQGPQNLGS